MKGPQMHINELGLITFPLKLSDHSPKIKEWQRISDNMPHTNIYGIQLRDDILVVDVDPRNGGNDSFSLLSFMVDFPETYTVKTGGGGLHLYYTKPDDIFISKSLKEYPGIDFLSKGCYVVGAGSKHKKGGNYTVILDAPLAEAPQELLDIIQKDLYKLSDAPAVEVDQEQATNRAINFINSVEGAIEGEQGNSHTYFVAAKCRDYGVSEEVCNNIMQDYFNPKCVPAWSKEELAGIIGNAYNYAQNTPGNAAPEVAFSPITTIAEDATDVPQFPDLGKGGVIKSSLKNVVHALTYSKIKGMFRFNELSKTVELSRIPIWQQDDKYTSNMTDADEINCKYFISHTYGLEVHISVIREAITVVAHKAAYNPLTQFLDGLVWDGIRRIDSWLTDICDTVDSLYTRDISRKILLGAVKRAYNPGCKFDQMLILESTEGYGKSTLCEVLGKGEFYCSLSLDVGSKDTAAQMAGKWIVELAEMDTARKADANALKAFLTRTIDRVRPAYGRNVVDFYRPCIFIGTFNPDEMGLLKADMGARRFWPVTTGKINLDKLRSEVDQLWAEAVHSYKAMPDSIVYLDNEEVIKMAAAEVNARRMADGWEHYISAFLDNNNISKTRVDDIWVDCFQKNIQALDKMNKSRIVACLLALGWEPKTYREGTTTTRGFVRTKPIEKEVSFDDL